MGHEEGRHEPQLVDVNTAANYLGVSPRFIRRLCSERRVAFFRIGRHVRFETADLDAFLEAGHVRPIQRVSR